MRNSFEAAVFLIWFVAFGMAVCAAAWLLREQCSRWRKSRAARTEQGRDPAERMDPGLLDEQFREAWDRGGGVLPEWVAGIGWVAGRDRWDKQVVPSGKLEAIRIKGELMAVRAHPERSV